MNALANWLGVTDQTAPRDYDNEAARAGFWDTVRQMSAIAIAAGAKQSDASRAQILGQLANVSSPTTGATRYAQANMQNMAAQRQREQYAADQNFTKGLDTMNGLSDNQRAILRAMGPGAREAYTQHAMGRAFEDPMVSMLRQSQIADNLSQSELRKIQVEQARREMDRNTSFDKFLGTGGGSPSAPDGMPMGVIPPAPSAATGGVPFPPPSVAPQQPTATAPAYNPLVGNGTVGMSIADMRTMRELGMKPADIMKKQAELIADNAKPEPGYMWTDASRTSQKPIPGSSKEAVPAEVASRLGQGEVFLSNLPQIRSAIDMGNLSGAGNSVKLGLGIGAPAELWRQIDQGMEAIVRMNTGAGQSGQEMIKAAKQYEPSPLDSVETLRSKINGLEAVLKQSMERVYQGRGGSSNRSLPSPTPFSFEENKAAAARVNPQAAPQGQLRPGTVDGGFVYLGGDPGQQSSWRAISEGYTR
jgi:hypothetical protein